MRVASTNYPLLGGVALVFVTSAAATIAWCGSMSGMDCVAMPWMRMPGQGWPGATASFLGMWTVMMVAMMLPALTPLLLRQCRGQAQAVTLAGGYFFVWSLAGVLLFPAGVVVADLAMQSAGFARAAPVLGALAMASAGLVQLSPWKARQLACCRGENCCERRPRNGSAWRDGLRAGIACCRCCLPMTISLLVLGVMDLAVMGVITLAITAERFASQGLRVARVTGAAMLFGGIFLLLRAA